MSIGWSANGFMSCTNSYERLNVRQMEVGLGEMVNVSFGGVPPFNLTTSVYSPVSGFSTCETAKEILHQNWYAWTVEPVIANGTSQGQSRREEHEFGVIDDEVYLVGTEMNGTTGNRYFGSPRYKIQAEASSGSRRSIWKTSHFVLATLVVVPALLSL